MSRSTKDKNFSARTSMEKSFENTFLTPKKNKYIVPEKSSNATAKPDLPKSNQPTYVFIRRSSNAGLKVTDKEEAAPKASKPIYVSIRKSSKVKEELFRSDQKPSIDEMVKLIKGSKILENRENREELLFNINNFLKYKQ